jgi:threonine/homoserine/homoserine lactone efflux protein
MPLDSLLLFFLAALALALTPGPDILTVLTRSITQGRAAGFAATFGFATGLVVHTAAAALGLALLLAQSPGAFMAIRFAGVLYLLYLALRMFLARDPVSLDQAPAPARALARIYTQSILMNILNPKVTLFFLAILPQFIDRRAVLPLPLQFTLLGALFALATILAFGACALLASTLSQTLRQKPTAARPLRIFTALLFLLIAVRLAFP